MIRFVAVDLLGERIGATRIMRRFNDSPAYFETFAANLETFLNQNGIPRNCITGRGRFTSRHYQPGFQNS